MGRPRLKTETLKGRFWQKVDRRGDNDCWIWNASLSSGGYGQIIALCADGKRRPKLASRVSWELHNGEIPGGMWVLHRCDNPPCVNPAHLFLGNDADNVADMRSKGRGVYVKGSRCGRAKLTESDVEFILCTHGVTQRYLAKMFGVDSSIISEIKSRKIWKHVA